MHLLKGNDSFYVTYQAVFFDNGFRTFHGYPNRQAGILSISGFPGLNNRLNILKDILYLVNFIRDGGHNKLIQIYRRPLGRSL